MPRTLPAAIGALLAIAVLVPPPLASAQILPWRRSQRQPAGMVRQGEKPVVFEGQGRIEEMRVELALLSDIGAFRYEVGVRADGIALEVSGFVPNDIARQRILQLVHRYTFLTVKDGLRMQDSLSVRQPRRSVQQLQQEGTELLQKNLGQWSKQISLEARTDGSIVLKGRIDSLESKVETSRLFRRLSGCVGVVNELTVEPIVFDGQRMVRVTRTGSMLVPPAMLGPEPEPTVPLRQQVNQPPPPQPSNALAAKDGELRLPIVYTQKQLNASTKPAQDKVSDDWEAFSPSKLPVKWSSANTNWEAQAKDLEAVHSATVPSGPQSPRQQAETTTKPLPLSANSISTAQSTSRQNQTPAPARTASNTNRGNIGPGNNVVDARTPKETEMTWRSPGGNEDSEPNISVVPREPGISAKPQPPSAPTAPALYSSRRWPPAYVTGPLPSKGQPGVIAFESDAPPPPKPTTSSMPSRVAIATSRPAVASDLQQQVKSLCGRQARAVTAAVQRDGSVLIKVTVANRSIEEQLSRKILSLPEMTGPNVRLLMEIEP